MTTAYESFDEGKFVRQNGTFTACTRYEENSKFQPLKYERFLGRKSSVLVQGELAQMVERSLSM